MKELIALHLRDHVRTIEMIEDKLSAAIENCCSLLSETLRRGNKILIMGNGGSAADAQHMAAEFVGRFLLERNAFPAIALTTDTSIITAIGNDYGFDEIFKRQVEALASPGDVVIGISTSGHSNNVFHALTAANEKGCKTIGLLGRDGGNIAGIVDISITVPTKETPRIQEAHLTMIHIICDLVEKSMCGRSSK